MRGKYSAASQVPRRELGAENTFGVDAKDTLLSRKALEKNIALAGQRKAPARRFTRFTSKNIYSSAIADAAGRVLLL